MLQPRGGATKVTLASAGHPPALVRRAEGNVEEHRQNGPITGLFADTIYQERVLRLEPGDLLLLYTDGLMDAKSASGVRVGIDTVVDVLADLPAGAGVHEVIAAYERLLEQYEIVDDVAVVAVATVVEHA